MAAETSEGRLLFRRSLRLPASASATVRYQSGSGGEPCSARTPSIGRTPRGRVSRHLLAKNWQ